MRVLKSLIVTFLAFAIGTHAVDTESDICSCTTCCNVANETSTHFTGKSIVEFTYPKVSLDGSYTIVGHRYDDGNGRLLAEVVDSLPYQYVVKYENDFKDAFDRNIFVFANNDATLNCTESHLYYGHPTDTTYKKIDFVKHETEDYCTLDIQKVLTREEIAYTDEIYFAFNNLVDEDSDFHIMYDLSEQGLIVPVTDIIEYPYTIYDGTVLATDVNEASAFYVNVSLDVFDISAADISELNTTGCLSIDEIFATEAVWITKTGGECPVEILSNGAGDATVAPGRNYQLRIDQEDYQNCAVKDVELVGDDLVFTFRLELPRSYEDTATDEGDGCYYFAENENVQNVTISMAQDVSSELDEAFINNFNTKITSVTPDQQTKCTGSMYPTPHAQIKFTIEATFPGDFGSTFPESGITLPELEGLTVEWDTVDGLQPATIPCQSIAGDAGAEDDQTKCQFNLRTVVCEPIYQTNDGECAFERNNTRLLTGFVVTEELPGGQTATYSSGDLNLGLDHTTFDISFCAADAEDAAVSVTDVFNVELDLQNYYDGYPVDWDAVDNITMNTDMIARLSVGQIATSPFDFDDDLELMIKVVTVELTNPFTNEIITSYTWSQQDKIDFMAYSWTPYHSDPRFCTWYNSGASDKCEKFFVDGTRSNTFHDAAWISGDAERQCQQSGQASSVPVDTNNYDYFLFTPREWFRDNAAGAVDMKITVTGVIHKCSDNPSRLLAAVSDGKIRGDIADRHLQTADPTVDVLYVSNELIISFIQRDGEDPIVSVKSNPEKRNWAEENSTLLIIAGVLGGLVILGLFFVALGKKKRYGILVGSHTSGPDF
jgi:hypothetical protein